MLIIRKTEDDLRLRAISKPVKNRTNDNNRVGMNSGFISPRLVIVVHVSRFFQT